jgi:hypothetical protein
VKENDEKLKYESDRCIDILKTNFFTTIPLKGA